jgi:predicted nucleic-acid-binding Zn-ribbon protein
LIGVRKSFVIIIATFKYKYMSELNKHWADKLQSGDRCLATIRHDYDGSKNIHRAIVIVIENMRFVKEVFVWYKEKQISIPYNELTEFDPHEVSTVTCNLCSYSWIAVRPEGLTELECPNCGNLSHFQNQAI